MDRVLDNWAWKEAFPHALAIALPIVNLDHSPIILKPKPPLTSGKAFSYKAFWEDHDDCRQVVANGWQGNMEDAWNQWDKRVNACKSHLVKWHKTTFRNAAKEIDSCKTQLQNLPNSHHHNPDWQRVFNLRKRIDDLWRQEEKYWGQRSRVKWLNWGDKNTKFFHASIVQRRDRKKLLRIKDTNGNWLEGQSQVMSGICNFYSNLYTPDPSSNFDRCLRVVPNCITSAMNKPLTDPISHKEINTSVLSMGAHKSPGDNGLNGLFY